LDDSNPAGNTGNGSTKDKIAFLWKCSHREPGVRT